MLVTRTYLELADPAALRTAGIPALPDARVDRLSPVRAGEFRRLYADVGAAWHWHDRDGWSDAAVEERFAGDRVTLWRFTLGGALAGFYELERHDDDSVEIALFGLLPGSTGRGAGKWLLADAVQRAWALGAARVWLHTCTLDAPAALPNYLARGFRPTHTEEYEVDG